MDNTSSRTHHSDLRKRSRSPQRDEVSPRDAKRRHHRHKDSHRNSPKVSLPFQSRHLHKHDLETYRALFAEYLDLQKNLDITRLSDDEVKGRWKSFLGKWNRGELAEGWYDPALKERADDREGGTSPANKLKKLSAKRSQATHEEFSDDDDDEGEFGPSLPKVDGGKKSGPAVPNLQELQYQREQADEDRQAHVAGLRYERKQDRRVQRERLEELAPRAQAGTRERQLEKKRDIAVSNKSFAEAREAGTEDVGDGDLLGDDVESFKARLKATEKQKNERELRKEEVLRARAAEREERLAVHRAKEDKTMEMLKDIARQRFGGVT